MVMIPSIAVVTTFNKKGYEMYGSKMIDTFLLNWPRDIKLFVYAENCEIKKSAENLVILDLLQASPELRSFKKKWKNVPKANGDISSIPSLAIRKDSHVRYKWNAIRFSHKVYSIFHCAKTCGTDLLLWMDGDTVCHNSIDYQTILKLCPPDKDLCFVGRKKRHSECGLYSMNLKSKSVKKFLNDFQKMYDDAENGIFKLEEWHDSFVFDIVRKNNKLDEFDWSVTSMLKNLDHPLINTEWGAYLDHLKGRRKKRGHSMREDLITNRSEKYWCGMH